MSDLQRVDLDEDPAASPEPDAAAPTPGPRRSRRGVLWLAVGAAVIGAGLVVGQAVLDARERAAVAALQEVPGITPPLGTALSVAYELPALRWMELSAEFDRGFYVADGGDSGVRLHALDLETDTELWDVPLADATETRTADTVRCDQGRVAEHGDVIACFDSDGEMAWDENGEYTWRAPTYARLTVLTQDDGEKVASWDLEGVAEQMAVIEDVVVTTSRDGKDAVLTARDLMTGEQRWQHVIPGSVLTAAEGGYGSVGVYAAGGVLYTSTDGGGAQLLTADGTPIAVEEGSASSAFDLDTLVVDLPNDANGSRNLIVRDGVVSPELRGEIVPTIVDDESLGDIALTSADGLTVWDVTTGERRWSLDEDKPGATYDMAYVVRGAVYLLGSSGLTAFDGRTGERRWAHETPQADEASGLSGGALTDGERLYVVQMTPPEGPEGTTTSRIEALTFDGKPAGEVALPDGVEGVSAYAGRLWGFRSLGADQAQMLLLR